jgi:tRNA (cytidine32/uridine32-2'-O)-methyltransferase
MNDQITNYLNNCRIILVNTTHSGNVGATARAMKTMGLSELYLVSADLGIIDDYALARSSGAQDILANCKIVPNLADAIVDCHYLLGTSARERTLTNTVLLPREAAKEAINSYVNHGYKIAIVFGQERIGLTNHELSLCHAQVLIPTSTEYSSLNIASAVQLLCYELRLAVLDLNNDFSFNKPQRKVKRDNDILAKSSDMELLYDHFERVMRQVKFLDPKQPKLLMQRLRRLFNRAHINTQELNILRGFLHACEKQASLSNSANSE